MRSPRLPVAADATGGQQVMAEPNPISGWMSRHQQPGDSTNTMASNAARSDEHGRPVPLAAERGGEETRFDIPSIITPAKNDT